MQAAIIDVQHHATAKGIEWKFIPPGAPHMGGAWERLVRSVKTALLSTLKEKSPREETLHTLLLEVEHIVNSRPLTPVSADLEEEALTPNHFLIGRSSGTTPIGTFKDECDKKSWEQSQHLADYFWKRWIKEYQPLLLTRAGNMLFENPKVGDVVLITDGNLPRCIWPRGEIVRTLPGNDGIVRVVEVRTNTGILKRPTSRLIPLVT